MMKRLWILLVLLILLCGCEEKTPAETTMPVQTSTAPTAQTTVPVEEDPGLYVPDSDVERQTGGAVREYRLSGDSVVSVTAEANRLLVLSSCSTGMYATELTGDTCVTAGQALLSGCSGSGQGSFRVTEDAAAYYDGGTRCVVLLDAQLKETARILLPDSAVGSPVISEDLSTVFYCTENTIHALDIETGISRLIRQHSCQWQTLNGSYFGDTVLQCYVMDENYQAQTLFLSTETGQLLGRDPQLLNFYARDDRFFLIRENGSLPEYLFGDSQGNVQALRPNRGTLYSAALAMDAVVGCLSEGGAVELTLYDLATGLRRASVRMENLEGVYGVTADGQYVWISVFDVQAQQDVLYRWDPDLSPAEDTAVYTGPRYTREEPDSDGIAACKEQARLLGQAYGVEIYLGEDIIAPWDYTLTTEYRVEALQLGLTQLEKALSAYPEGFFTTVVEETATGVIRVSLVRDISDGMDGLQYWIDGDAYIALKISADMEPDVYHEISHVLDNYIIANCYAYDDWEELNPEGAVYDYSYAQYQNRTDWTWLEGENRAFIDSYSMSYPKEDRARILEYAMTPGNEELFKPEYLQKKLLQICEGIRESFGWERYEGTFIWEQYLNTSLAYTKKK